MVGFRPLARGVSGCLLDTLLLILDTLLSIFVVYIAMGWKGIGHPIHPKCVYIWTPNSEILAKALVGFDYLIIKWWNNNNNVLS